MDAMPFRFLLPPLLLFFCSSCCLIPRGPDLRTPEDFQRVFPVASGSASVPPGSPLPLEEVCRIALANNPDLRAARFAVKAAR